MGLMLSLAATGLGAAPLTRQSVNGAELKKPVRGGSGPVVMRAQILLDRAFFSPGVIDGKYGGNTKKALKTYQSAKGLEATGALDQPTWDKLTGADAAPALTTYKVTKDDVNGPFVKKIPSGIRKQAKLKRLAYTSPAELLGETFHVSPEVLRTLNPGKKLTAAGTQIVVPNVGGRKPSAEAATLVVDKARSALKAYDKNGKLIAFYPATIGSTEYPAPKGKLKIRAVAVNPVYTYTDNLDFAKLKKGEKVIKVAPGPNNPVGVVWLDLTKQGYGIHGTPDPAKVGKNYSHGCIRLTNWDARELAGLVDKGTPVVFSG
jgi:lipoprotein-anchoring transpeptidase ErfK/SrfK